MQSKVRIPAWTLLIAALCLASGAQQQDPDRYNRSKTSTTAPPPELRIDINHASLEALLKVPGMKASWAGRIVRFRPYRTKQDVVDNGIVSSEVYERIKDYVIAHRDPQ